MTCATAWIRRQACHTANAFACIWLPFVQDVGPKRQPTAIACLRTHLQTECLYYDVVGLIFVCGALCVPQGPLHLAAFACVCLRLPGLCVPGADPRGPHMCLLRPLDMSRSLAAVEEVYGDGNLDIFCA